MVYFQGDMKSPMEREIYSVDLNGGAPKMIKGETGTNSAAFSTTFDLFVWTHSGINTPTSYVVNDRSG
ncbi:MAG: DPP IV N-terminal domain-containing protein, partial [Saprospiraceae bacterium]|nr:DPP IV N-terminal domain-containing protein [Candidatus Opimibacter skivensis]